jgi:hypothetical protein
MTTHEVAPELTSSPLPQEAAAVVPTSGPRAFRFSAVVIGLLADVASTLVLASLAGSVMGIVLGVGGSRTPAEIAEAFAEIMSTPAWLLAMLVVGLLGSALGGLVAALLARHAPMRHALATGVASLLLGALAQGVGGTSPTHRSKSC